MDFNVGSQAITITSLGAFDSGQDGINGTIQVGIFDRATSTLVGSTATFNGTSQALVGNSRFSSVGPFNLSANGAYSIVAVGYNANELNGNHYFGGSLSTINTGAGLISFTGISRFNFGVGAVLSQPTIPDNYSFSGYPNGGPANRYDAGTFTFTSAVPEPSEWAMMLGGLLTIGCIAKRRRQQNR
jgi:hypothetical protein